jgi:hypothetical protein
MEKLTKKKTMIENEHNDNKYKVFNMEMIWTE